MSSSHPNNDDLPSQEYLRRQVEYNAETGVFTWLTTRRIGKRAGGPAHRYRYIAVPGFRYIGEHRLAWIYVHGHIPRGMKIDHADCNPSHNAIANLRLATNSQQNQNRRAMGRSGLKGAHFRECCKSRPWTSKIAVNGKEIRLGSFVTAEEAHAAYAEAARVHFGEFTRLT